MQKPCPVGTSIGSRCIPCDKRRVNLFGLALTYSVGIENGPAEFDSGVTVPIRSSLYAAYFKFIIRALGTIVSELRIIMSLPEASLTPLLTVLVKPRFSEFLKTKILLKLEYSRSKSDISISSLQSSIMITSKAPLS